MGTVACPPHVTMLRLGASRWSSRLTTGTQYGPMAAGVRSRTRTPVSLSFAQLARCAVAEVASKTSLMSPKFGIASRPSIPSAVIGTPMRLARANPSESGSMPTIAPIVSGPSLRRILIIRSVPMLPDPMIATGHSLLQRHGCTRPPAISRSAHVVQRAPVQLEQSDEIDASPPISLAMNRPSAPAMA